MLRHLLGRWQDKLVVIGQHVNPKPRPPSPKRKRSRKSKPKRLEVIEAPPSSDEDLDNDMDDTYEPEEKPEKKKKARAPRLPRRTPVKAPADGKPGVVKKKRVKNPGGKRGRPALTPAQLRLKKSRYKCTQCDAAFSIPSRLKDHYRVHTGERPYACDKCNQTFMRDMHLKRHKLTHMGVRPFKCTMCAKTFINRTSLKIHTYSHTGERPHQCPCCPQRFVKKNTLNEHMRVHTGETPHHCMICDLKFHKKSQLKAHMLYHTGEKPYLCTTCGTRFRHNTSLAEHERIHTGHKPFVCQHCGTAFRCRSTLTKHVRLHTGEKPYVCPVCDTGFAQKTSLQSHMRQHPGVALPTKFTVKPSSKGENKEKEVCLYPVVGRKKRPVQAHHQQPEHDPARDPTRAHAHSAAMTMANLSSTVDQLLSVPDPSARMDPLRNQHLDHVRGPHEPPASNSNMAAQAHTHTSSNQSHPGSHFPISSAWSHDLPTSAAGFQYDQTTAAAAVHRAQQVTSQPFAGFLPMSTQMPTAFPDQQRFPLDYRFSMN